MGMIGGIVTETKRIPERIWINCEEERSSSRCAIYVERNEKSELIQPGDSLWWQGGYAMWTPYLSKSKRNGRSGFDYDIKIKRIGCSGVGKP